MNYVYVVGTILFTVYGQLILKWRMGFYGQLPSDLWDKMLFLVKLLLDPYILSSFIAAFVAALCWMAALTKFDLSYAYPFMSLSFVLVLVLSGIMLREPITTMKILGLALIILGVMVTAKSI
ncbi:MAG: EamA family transporter [Acidobacteriota bacterium]